MSGNALVDATDQLCTDAIRHLPDAALGAEAAALLARLHGPLRVAIAGRIKAGKSTLLNALVRDRVAPTDAGECTRVVTWYTEGISAEVNAVLRDGSLRPVAIERDDEGVRLDLGSLGVDAIDRIDVRWPARALADLTVIDTPGLASINAETSRRTEKFLAVDALTTSDADAVIYLMRHVHQRDIEFLDAFMDRSVAGTSPINAVGVLSRADEIGAGRVDALASAERIARRYSANHDVRSLCGSMVAVAGLLAETSSSLREDEVGHLRRLLDLDDRARAELLVTSDRFCDPLRSSLTGEVRAALLARFGLFGIRYTLDELRREPDLTASQLARRLRGVSGIEDLERVLAEQFAPRARSLQARAVLSGVRALAHRIRASSPAHETWLLEYVERVEAASHDLSELRLLHLALSGEARLADGETEEVRATLLAVKADERVGRPDAPAAEVQAIALERIQRWRVRASDPLADPTTTEASEIMAHTYEAIYANPAG